MQCDVPFGRPSDLQRHLKAVHLKTEDFWCPVDGCNRSLFPLVEQLKPFPRKDKRKDHFLKIHRGVEIDLEAFDEYVTSLVAVPATDEANTDLYELSNGFLVQQHGGFPPMDIGVQTDFSLFDLPLEGTLANNPVLPQDIGVQGPYHATQAGYHTGLNSNIPVNDNRNGFLGPRRIDNTPIQYEYNTHAAVFPGFVTGGQQSFNANQEVDFFPAQGPGGFDNNTTDNNWMYHPTGDLAWGINGFYNTSFGNVADLENVGNGEQWNNGDGFNSDM
jgi:hypothetical protein